MENKLKHFDPTLLSEFGVALDAPTMNMATPGLIGVLRESRNARIIGRAAFMACFALYGLSHGVNAAEHLAPPDPWPFPVVLGDGPIPMMIANIINEPVDMIFGAAGIGAFIGTARVIGQVREALSQSEGPINWTKMGPQIAGLIWNNTFEEGKQWASLVLDGATAYWMIRLSAEGGLPKPMLPQMLLLGIMHGGRALLDGPKALNPFK